MIKKSRKEKAIIKSLSPQISEIRLSKTMIDKYTVDANPDTQRLYRLLCQDQFGYEQLKNGEKHFFDGQWHDGTPCKVCFYKAKTRGDKRISISGIMQKCKADDLISLSFKTDGEEVHLEVSVKVTNVTSLAEKRVA